MKYEMHECNLIKTYNYKPEAWRIIAYSLTKHSDHLTFILLNGSICLHGVLN